MTITGWERVGSVPVAEAEPEREEWVFREARERERAGSGEDHPALPVLAVQRPACSIARQPTCFAIIGYAGRSTPFDALGRARRGPNCVVEHTAPISSPV